MLLCADEAGSAVAPAAGGGVSAMATDGRSATAQKKHGVLGVRKPGKAGKRGTLSHKQKRRKAMALEKVCSRREHRMGT